MEANLNLKGKGDVTVILIKDGKRTVLQKTNQITTNARNICARSLIDSSYKLDTISAHFQGNLLTSSNVTTSPDPTDAHRVQAVARFNQTSFNGTLDELRLESNAGGIFAQLTGLSVNKDGQSQLEILWKIAINNL